MTKRIVIIALILFALGAIDALGQGVSGGSHVVAPTAAAGATSALPGSATGAAGLGLLRYDIDLASQDVRRYGDVDWTHGRAVEAQRNPRPRQVAASRNQVRPVAQHPYFDLPGKRAGNVLASESDDRDGPQRARYFDFALASPSAQTPTAPRQRPFWRDWRVWTGISLTAGGVLADQRTQRALETRGGVEGNLALRDASGHLRTGKQWALWAGVNALLLPGDIKPRYRWVTFTARCVFAGVWLRAAQKNRGTIR